ncbi:hypothetical protein M011DRAFT_502387 [Sporormia fimetaria CBS 119925]|uniref:Uncharacterized protein n=1 Tax=Sporormia fimetaria CBS 119925 TaxID=1340428 RepID=A0A6A6V9Q0_9PLEO|nr:hypothetical protein M011DRAFT_502387 [Sporormia fimetaria CBS 119925]
MAVLSKLESLPVELQHLITSPSNLKLPDLLALRAASRICERMTQKNFANWTTSHCKPVYLYQTYEVLRLLTGLCHILEFLKQVQHICIISMRQVRLRSRYFEYPLDPALKFEASQACKELWIELCELLKRSPTFKRFYIGDNLGREHHDTGFGADQLIKLYKRSGVHMFVQEELHWRHLSTPMGALMAAVVKTGFDLSQVRLKGGSTSHHWHLRTGSIREYSHLSLPQYVDWEDFVRGCIRSARFLCSDYAVDVNGHDQGQFIEHCFELVINTQIPVRQKRRVVSSYEQPPASQITAYGQNATNRKISGHDIKTFLNNLDANVVFAHTLGFGNSQSAYILAFPDHAPGSYVPCLEP